MYTLRQMDFVVQYCGLPFPFYKKTILIQDRTADWDHELCLKQCIPLPRDGWRFKKQG